MTTRELYIDIKQKDLKELERKVAEFGDSDAPDVEKFRKACQSASGMLDRLVNEEDSAWIELQRIVDDAFRNAYDCLRQIDTR